MLFKLLILAVFVPALIAAELHTVEVESCPEGILPTAVRSQYCAAAPCTFVQGGPIGFEMDFISPIDTNTLNVTVKANIGILNMDQRIPPEHQDGCATLRNSACPLHVGDEVTYEIDFILDAIMTNVTPTIRFTLRDDNQKAIVCFGIKSYIAKE